MSERPVDPANQRFAGESCDFAPPNTPSGHASGRAVAPRTVILFDGVCDLCDTGMAWLRRHDRAGRLEFLAYQSPEVAARWPGLDPARLAAAVHVITPDGRVHIGADAAAPIFACLPGWGLAARALALPFARMIGRPFYAWVAARRHIFLTGHRRGV